jgi:hypothetical protein
MNGGVSTTLVLTGNELCERENLLKIGDVLQPFIITTISNKEVKRKEINHCFEHDMVPFLILESCHHLTAYKIAGIALSKTGNCLVELVDDYFSNNRLVTMRFYAIDENIHLLLKNTRFVKKKHHYLLVDNNFDTDTFFPENIMEKLDSVTVSADFLASLLPSIHP